MEESDHSEPLLQPRTSLTILDFLSRGNSSSRINENPGKSSLEDEEEILTGNHKDHQQQQEENHHNHQKKSFYNNDHSIFSSSPPPVLIFSFLSPFVLILIINAVASFSVALTSTPLKNLLLYYLDDTGLSCVDHSDLSGCDSVNNRSANIFTIVGAIAAALQCLAAPVTGALSDCIGRRPFVIWSQILLIISIIFMLFYILGFMNFWFAFLLWPIRSLVSANYSACLVDLQPHGTRAKGIALYIAFLFIMDTLGPLISALIGNFFSFLLAVLLACFSLFLAYFFPDSLLIENRRLYHHSIWNPWTAYKILFTSRYYTLLIGIFSCMYFSLIGTTGLSFYLVTEKYSISQTGYGIFFAIFGFIGGILQLLFFPVFTRWISLRNCLSYSGFAILIAIPMVALGNSPWMLYLGFIGFLSWGYLVFPSISALKADATRIYEHGVMQGCVMGVNGFLTGVAPLVLQLLNDSIKLPGVLEETAGYWLAVLITIVGIFLAFNLPSKEEVAALEEWAQKEQPPQPHAGSVVSS